MPSILSQKEIDALLSALPVEDASLGRPPAVGLSIGDRLLGGLGKGLTKARELTDVEATLLETVVWEVLSSLKESWANIAQLQPRLGDIAFTPQFLQVALSSETV